MLQPACFEVVDRRVLHEKAVRQTADKTGFTSAYLSLPGFSGAGAPAAAAAKEAGLNSADGGNGDEAATAAASQDLPPGAGAGPGFEQAAAVQAAAVHAAAVQAAAVQRQDSQAGVDAPEALPRPLLRPCCVSSPGGGGGGRAVAVPVTAVLFTQGINEQQCDSLSRVAALCFSAIPIAAC